MRYGVTAGGRVAAANTGSSSGPVNGGAADGGGGSDSGRELEQLECLAAVAVAAAATGRSRWKMLPTALPAAAATTVDGAGGREEVTDFSAGLWGSGAAAVHGQGAGPGWSHPQQQQQLSPADQLLLTDQLQLLLMERQLRAQQSSGTSGTSGGTTGTCGGGMGSSSSVLSLTVAQRQQWLQGQRRQQQYATATGGGIGVYNGVDGMDQEAVYRREWAADDAAAAASATAGSDVSLVRLVTLQPPLSVGLGCDSRIEQAAAPTTGAAPRHQHPSVHSSGQDRSQALWPPPPPRPSSYTAAACNSGGGGRQLQAATALAALLGADMGAGRWGPGLPGPLAPPRNVSRRPDTDRAADNAYGGGGFGVAVPGPGLGQLGPLRGGGLGLADLGPADTSAALESDLLHLLGLQQQPRPWLKLFPESAPAALPCPAPLAAVQGRARAPVLNLSWDPARLGGDSAGPSPAAADNDSGLRGGRNGDGSKPAALASQPKAEPTGRATGPSASPSARPPPAVPFGRGEGRSGSPAGGGYLASPQLGPQVLALQKPRASQSAANTPTPLAPWDGGGRANKTERGTTAMPVAAEPGARGQATMLELLLAAAAPLHQTGNAANPSGVWGLSELLVSRGHFGTGGHAGATGPPLQAKASSGTKRGAAATAAAAAAASTAAALCDGGSDGGGGCDGSGGSDGHICSGGECRMSGGSRGGEAGRKHGRGEESGDEGEVEVEGGGPVKVYCRPRPFSRYLTLAEVEALLGVTVMRRLYGGGRLLDVRVRFHVGGRTLPEVHSATIERYSSASPCYVKAATGRGQDGLPWRLFEAGGAVQWRRMSDDTLVMAQVSKSCKRSRAGGRCGGASAAAASKRPRLARGRARGGGGGRQQRAAKRRRSVTPETSDDESDSEPPSVSDGGDAEEVEGEGEGEGCTTQTGDGGNAGRQVAGPEQNKRALPPPRNAGTTGPQAMQPEGCPHRQQNGEECAAAGAEASVSVDTDTTSGAGRGPCIRAGGACAPSIHAPAQKGTRGGAGAGEAVLQGAQYAAMAPLGRLVPTWGGGAGGAGVRAPK
ncbi:hypothetical protein HYH03_011218 [Edaphochlamys debaryana]|uniref:Uncharacterized protein n=1 Tax=Edaphochlamys debaryana TaxID=47281 RepID=A0A835XU29_9CHLO|nr:hypothetical protein HYH03_011218 [Edaphochlamys debaryana]|eukprot:KAG2490263.1 hypothetical protein HYH03_011218 [Edaphochlamys debaryana]